MVEAVRRRRRNSESEDMNLEANEKKMRQFEVGENVEVQNINKRMPDIFYCGVILKIEEEILEVSFDASADFPKELRRSVSTASARPQPPSFMQRRPRRRGDERDHYSVGDVVEAREKGCWWRGVVVWNMKNHIENFQNRKHVQVKQLNPQQFVVYFPANSSLKSIPSFLLRPGLDWSDHNRWTLLPRLKGTPTLAEILENAKAVNRITFGPRDGADGARKVKRRTDLALSGWRCVIAEGMKIRIRRVAGIEVGTCVCEWDLKAKEFGDAMHLAKRYDGGEVLRITDGGEEEEFGRSQSPDGKRRFSQRIRSVRVAMEKENTV